MEIFFSTVFGLASVAGLIWMAYSAGQRNARKALGVVATESRVYKPDDALELAVKQALENDPSDIKIVGYSVHAITDVAMPAIRRSLIAGKKVQILVLDSSSDAIHEKSELEADAHQPDLESFRERSRSNTEKLVNDLVGLRDQISYQENLSSINLQIRSYNQTPHFRGVIFRGISAAFASYFTNPTSPGRETPHFLMRSPLISPIDKLLEQQVESWFDYLWQYRSRLPHVTAVVFDLYETIVRIEKTARVAARQQMAERLGVPIERFNDSWLATQNDSNRGVLNSTEARFKKIIELLSVEIDDNLITDLSLLEESTIHENVEVRDELKSVIHKLRRRGYRIGLLSNCSVSALHALNAAKITPLFDAVSLSFQSHHLKPEPSSYESCLQLLGCSAEQCVFVGDGENEELVGAEGIGMIPLQFIWDGNTQPNSSGVRKIRDHAEIDAFLLESYDRR